MGWRYFWARVQTLYRRRSEADGEERYHAMRQRMNPGMRVRGLEH